MSLKEQIKLFFKGDIEDTAETLDTYSRDASLFSMRPQIVVFPKDAEDIKNLVQFVRKQADAGHHMSLTARAAGTDMTGGPLTTSILVVFTKYMNKLHELGENYAVVQPGMYYRDFEKETLKKGLLFPSFPASREICAMGGIVANNSGGEKTLAYGKTENYVEAIKMILEDGEEYLFTALTQAELDAKKKLPTVEGDIYRKIARLIDEHDEELQAAKPRVSKNSAGYYLWNVRNKEKGTFDLTKLIVGSQGTLGIITEIRLRLVKPKPHARLLVIFLNDMQELGRIVNTVLEYKPESFESYDDHTFKLAVRLLPQIARRLKGNILRIGWRFLGEMRMVLFGGVPKLVLLAEFSAATAEEAERQAKKAEAALQGFGLQTKVTASEQEAEKYWVVRRESFNLLRQHVSGMRTAPFIDDFVVRPEVLPKFLPQLYALLDKYPIVYTVAGHVGDGDFHVIPLMDMTKKESLDIIKKLGREVYELVFQFKGSMTGEHNDGLIRGPYLEMMYGEKIYKLFLETKDIFDPYDIFNPGKKVRVNVSFALGHIALE